MISDFVKGKKKFDYSEGVQKGIGLHRAIDEFTDKHPITLEAKKFFKPAYGLYAGAFMDIVYDHFLANDRSEFKQEEDLKAFSHGVYRQIGGYQPDLPERFQRVFFYMQGQDWLYHYRFKESIFNSFKGLVRRAKFIEEYQSACLILEEHYEALHFFYAGFFPDLKKFAHSKWADLAQAPGDLK
jgi:acyl carrier protein phosphodiesterase